MWKCLVMNWGIEVYLVVHVLLIIISLQCIMNEDN